MHITENIPLANYSTMRLGGKAAFLAEVSNKQEVSEAVEWATQKKLPIIMIGGGSNTIWRDEGFDGLVLINKIKQLDINHLSDKEAAVTIGGGEDWDAVVALTTQEGLSGFEFLSLIPGTAGAAPIQNIGAYGHEIADTLVSVEAFDTATNDFVTLEAQDCNFGYRTSRFKTNDRHRFFITAITCKLTKTVPEPPYYHAFEKYINEHDIEVLTPETIRNGIIEIRNSKLPNPAQVPNTGSFFANPVISAEHQQQILAQHPKLADWHSTWFWQLPDGRYKIAAGALLEYLDFRGYEDPETGMATWSKQALVLINKDAKKTADLLKFRQKIIDTVKQTFGITLEQEPELLP